MKYTKREFEKMLKDTLMSECNVTLDTASADQIYRCLASITRQIMSDRQKRFQSKVLGEGKKQVYYLCMEFLMGRSLRTSLFNLGLNEVAESVLADADIKIDTIYDREPDAGLGNGGLGRLAACYLDGMATDCIPGTGYSILYEYGIFKQKIVDGWQQETADNWLPGGQVWIKSHPDQAQEIRFDGQAIETWEGGFHHVKYENYNSVIAVPNDMYVAGYGSQGVSKLRLWQAKAPSFDMSSFNAGNYNTAISQSAFAELISKILYPNDNHTEGKILRLRQQYFFSAASIADILQNHLNQYGTLDNLPDKVAIQLNDTHPTVAIPEMMRILLDECSYEWDAAFDICRKVFAYTNHTVMSEALERWNEDLMRTLLPRIYQIIVEINNRFCGKLHDFYNLDGSVINRMSIIYNHQVHMANLSIVGSHSVNGVSNLHSQILKDDLFHDFYQVEPHKFTNVTNGIASRRWLYQSNPRLTRCITDLIGDGFLHDMSQLQQLKRYENDPSVLEQLAKIKLENKKDFARYIKDHTGQVIDPNSLFDVQVKRLHEYKRQHLNALQILTMYNEIKTNPHANIQPTTFIFGAKAAPGYYLAKQIIKFICSLGEMLENDPQTRDLLKIVYLEDYRVTLSELLMPASEISEQISLAGTEASGTGNMKLMLNGAVTIGTWDGANIEIGESVGPENIFVFGMRTPEVNQVKASGYYPTELYASNPVLRDAIDMLTRGGIAGDQFPQLSDSLKHKDPYMVLRDFVSYDETRRRAHATYQNDQTRWQKMSLVNIAQSGYFCADRAIQEYAHTIWNLD